MLQECLHYGREKNKFTKKIQSSKQGRRSKVSVTCLPEFLQLELFRRQVAFHFLNHVDK